VAIGISASVGLFSALVLKASAHLFTTDAEAAAHFLWKTIPSGNLT